MRVFGLEESEHGDRDSAREWLERSFSAAPDPAWICGDCGARHSDWAIECAVCGAFDKIDWRHPPATEAWREASVVKIEPMAEVREVAETA